MTESEILDFSARVLEGEGAIAAPAGPGVLDVVLPPELGRRLALDEFARLVDGVDGGEPCGYGSEMLRRIAAVAVGAGRAAAWRAEVPLSVRRAPELTGLNVSLGAARTSESTGWILIGAASYRAAADDERLGLVEAAVIAPGGVAVPPPELARLPLAPIGPDDVPADLVEPAWPRLLAALRGRIAGEAADFQRSVARRAARDAERLERYFRDVAADLRRRARRRRGDALEAKRASLPLELEARMAQLEADCKVRVELKIVALAAIAGPAVTAQIEVRRRKHRRLLEVRYDAITRRWSGLRCGGCGAATTAFAMCDEAEHILCAACWDACGTGGHRPCLRCAGRPEEEPWARAARTRPAASAAPLASARAGAGPALPAAGPAAAAPPPAAAPRPAAAAPPAAARPTPAAPGPPAAPIAAAGAADDRLRAEVLDILRKHRVPLSSEEILARARSSRATLERILASLVERGAVDRLEGPRATLYFARVAW